MAGARFRKLILPLWVLLAWCSSVVAQPAVETLQIPPYDYTQTKHMALHGPQGFVFMFGPFEHPAPSMGALVYEMILLYVPEFQPIIIPPVEPTYAIDLIMEDRDGVKRLGQRLYVGDAWLSDGRGVAFMTSADYRRFVSLLGKRYNAGEHLDAKKFFADLRRPETHELPDDWQVSGDSAQRAARRLLPSDWDPGGHDPGAQVRPRPQGWRSLRRDAPSYAAEPPEQTASAGGSAASVPADSQPLKKPVATAPLEPEAPVVAALESEQADEPVHERAPSEEDDSSRRWFLVVLALVIFALVKLIGRKRWRGE